MSAHDQDGFLPRPPQEMTFLTQGTDGACGLTL